MSSNIISQHDTHFNSTVTSFSADDLKTEIRKLEAQVAIQRDELDDIEHGHKARPYRSAFMARIRRSYRESLRELHSQIESARALIAENSVSVQM